MILIDGICPVYYNKNKKILDRRDIYEKIN
jgi:hypothetical protein